MKNKYSRRILIALAVVVIAILSFLLSVQPVKSDVEKSDIKRGLASGTSTVASLSPAQEKWIDDLEQCESGGDPTAINLVDRDGTSSYYSFQFKPDTFRSYGVLYGTIAGNLSRASIMELIKDRSLQRSIVSFMVLDSRTNWEQQFPVCVSILERPPKK